MTTRREVINTLVAATTAAALEIPLRGAAQAVDAEGIAEQQALTQPSFDEFREFVEISEALTGIEGDLLAADRKPQIAKDGTLVRDANGRLIAGGADPTQEVKLTYFRLATADPSVYRALRDEFSAELGKNKQSKRDADALTAAATPLLASQKPGVADLARSIIMAWYFGVWYEWNVSGRPRFTVVSAQAYAEGWIWRIAQAHPPGYSNLRFGHWAHAPSGGLLPETLTPVGEPA